MSKNKKEIPGIELDLWETPLPKSAAEFSFSGTIYPPTPFKKSSVERLIKIIGVIKEAHYFDWQKSNKFTISYFILDDLSCVTVDLHLFEQKYPELYNKIIEFFQEKMIFSDYYSPNKENSGVFYVHDYSAFKLRSIYKLNRNSGTAASIEFKVNDSFILFQFSDKQIKNIIDIGKDRPEAFFKTLKEKYKESGILRESAGTIR